MAKSLCSVVISSEEGEIRREVPFGTPLFQLLAGNDAWEKYIRPSCTGRGLCGGCAVCVSGNVGVPGAEERYLLGERLEQGYRLACRCFVFGDLTVHLNPLPPPENAGESRYGVALLANNNRVTAELYNLSEDRLMISRSEASVLREPHPAEDLCAAVRKQIDRMIYDFRRKFLIPEKNVRRITLAAEPFFHDLYAGLRTEAPGQPREVVLDSLVFQAEQVNLTSAPEATVELPGMMADLLGSDLEMAILSSGMYRSEGPVLLIDLGGSICLALGNRQALFCTAMPEIGADTDMFSLESGAVIRVWRKKYHVYCQTTWDAPPTGVALSGAVSALETMQSMDLLDQNGRIRERSSLKSSKQRMLAAVNGETVFYLDRPRGVFISQAMLDAIQRVQTALRAGVKALFARFGTTWDELVTVYVTGQNSFDIQPEQIALMLGEYAGSVKKIVQISSMTMSGTALYLRNARARANAEHIRTTAVFVPPEDFEPEKWKEEKGR